MAETPVHRQWRDTNSGSRFFPGAQPPRLQFRPDPGPQHDHGWKPFAIKGITLDSGYSRVTLQPLTGSGFGPSRTVSGPLPVTQRDREHVLAQLGEQAAPRRTTPDEVAAVTEAVGAARTRAEPAGALKIYRRNPDQFLRH